MDSVVWNRTFWAQKVLEQLNWTEHFWLWRWELSTMAACSVASASVQFAKSADDRGTVSTWRFWLTASGRQEALREEAVDVEERPAKRRRSLDEAGCCFGFCDSEVAAIFIHFPGSFDSHLHQRAGGTLCVRHGVWGHDLDTRIWKNTDGFSMSTVVLGSCSSRHCSKPIFSNLLAWNQADLVSEHCDLFRTKISQPWAKIWPKPKPSATSLLWNALRHGWRLDISPATWVSRCFHIGFHIISGQLSSCSWIKSAPHPVLSSVRFWWHQWPVHHLLHWQQLSLMPVAWALAESWGCHQLRSKVGATRHMKSKISDSVELQILQTSTIFWHFGVSKNQKSFLVPKAHPSARNLRAPYSSTPGFRTRRPSAMRSRSAACGPSWDASDLRSQNGREMPSWWISKPRWTC